MAGLSELGQLLHEEHFRILVGACELENRIRGESADRPLNASDAEDRHLLSNLLDGLDRIMVHHAFEEAVVFPLIRDSGDGELTTLLTREHGAIEPKARLLGLLGRQLVGRVASADEWARFRHAAADLVAEVMHTGRVGHVDSLPVGGRVVAPSAVAAAGGVWSDKAMGLAAFPVPEAFDAAGIAQARDEFVHAAKNAIAAGFDGIELHAANGYLFEQFLNPHSNHRADAYGGSIDNRIRFVVETAEATASAIGADRVGIRLSPFNTHNDLPLYDEVRAQYTALARGLRGLLYVHIVTNPHAETAATHEAMRRTFEGPIIINGNYDEARAEAVLAAREADLVSFGRPFVANPDLVERLRTGAPLATPNPATFFSASAEGYTDYPSM